MKLRQKDMSRPRWVWLDVHALSHPKWQEIERQHGHQRMAVLWWGYCRALGLSVCHLTDGNVFASTLGISDADEAASQLAAAGLLEPLSDGRWHIHDFEECQPMRKDWETLVKARARAGRKGGKQKASKCLASARRLLKQTASKPLARPSDLILSDPDLKSDLKIKSQEVAGGEPVIVPARVDLPPVRVPPVVPAPASPEPPEDALYWAIVRAYGDAYEHACGSAWQSHNRHRRELLELRGWCEAEAKVRKVPAPDIAAALVLGIFRSRDERFVKARWPLAWVVRDPAAYAHGEIAPKPKRSRDEIIADVRREMDEERRAMEATC